MTDKKISILLPTVNRPVYLRAALRSIAEQTIVNSIYEIIVSENGLNRESEIVCREFPELPVKYYYQEKQIPPVEHIKKVFNMSSGDILAFLGDDDWWAPGHLEDALTSLSKHKNAAAYFSRAVYVINEEVNYELTMPSLAFSLVPVSDFDKTEFIYKYPEIVSSCWLFTPFHFSTLTGKRDVLLPAINNLYGEVEFYNSDRELYPLLAENGDIVFNDVADTFVRWYDGNSTGKVKQEELDKTFNKGSQRILGRANADIKELAGIWQDYISGVNDKKILTDVNTKLQRLSDYLQKHPELLQHTQQSGKTYGGSKEANNREICLAVFTPFLGALSETFIQKHIDLLAPGKVVAVTGNIQNNRGNIPVLQIPWSEGAYKYAPETENEVIKFLFCHNVTHILAEYGCQGTEIVELNARKLKLPLYVHFHGYDASQMLKRQDIIEYYKWMSRNVSGVITCSYNMAEKLAAAGLKRESLIVNHYGIDIPEETSGNTGADICRFVFVGRLVEKKAPMVLLQSFLLAYQKAKNITLDIIGDEGIYGQSSRLLPQLKNFVNENNLNNVVTFHGAQGQEYVGNTLKSSSVYVQHSVTAKDTGDQEGLPNSILEAAAFGLPVISTLHSGIPEEVEDGVTGFLVPEYAAEAMAEKMILLAGNPELRSLMGMRGRAKVINEFTTEKSINSLHDIIFSRNYIKTELQSPLNTVTVIIPAYNREVLIERAIKSIQNQTIPVNEIIIVDDASEDNTEALIRKLAESDKRIKYIKLAKNSGAQAARNTGIKNSVSEWVAFLDSDDFWLPGRVANALAAAEKYKADVVYSNYIKKDTNGTETVVNPPARYNDVFTELLKGSFVTFPGLFVRRSCFVETGYLDESVRSWQEWDTALRLSRKYRFAYDENPGFVWVWHGGETISKDNTRELVGYLSIILKYREEILQRCGADRLNYHLNNVLNKINALKPTEELLYLKQQVTKYKLKLEEPSGIMAG
jgi:glycosyltransferase involved in cell wall biosynthesis